MEQILTYKFRLLPTRRQHCVLIRILEQQRQLYNAALQERVDARCKIGKSITYFDQAKSLTMCRRDLPDMRALPANIQRGTLSRLDLAFKGFFRRVKCKGKAGFPRFKGRGWWKTFEFKEFSGIMLEDNRLYFKGMPGSLRVHMHRSLPGGRILNAKFKRDVKGWFVCLGVRVRCMDKRIVSNSVGIDFGLRTLATLSDGVMIPNPRVAQRAEKKMRRQQRQLARCKYGSKRREKVKLRLARSHRKITDTRSTYLHQVSAMLVKTYDLIAIEDLNVKSLARSKLARDVNDASWGKLIEFLTYKAERAGTYLISVDPKYTSQDCSRCGYRVKKSLSVRTHRCPKCELVLDRDVNAARNILDRAVVRPGLGNVDQWVTRSAGNLNLIRG